LERMREKSAATKAVIFVHVPPLGQTVLQAGKAVPCDEEILRKFAQALLEVKVVEIQSRAAVAGQEKKAY
ncbi:MAG: hypothetical protein N3A66_11695, partial [Planctomycetota bacterium]|nr:hypothetical protein [Planctomycetota bacterium]